MTAAPPTDGDRAAAPPPPAGRRRAFRVAAALAPVVLLLAVEGALRAAGLPRDDAAARAAGKALDLADPRLFVRDPELLWVLRPSSRIDVGDAEYPPFTTNARGLRGADFATARGDDEIRVVCMGDSVTFGLGLAEGRTLPERLEEHLRGSPRLAGRAVRVLNAGVPGWSSVQGLRMLRRVEDARPDLVVWWFGMNDAKPSLGVPDEDVRLPGAADRALGGLRLLALTRSLVRSTDDGPRVPAATFARNLAAAREVADVVAVAPPHRVRTTLSELDAVADAARAAGADEVRGSFPLLSEWTPTPVAADSAHRLERTADGRPRVVFGSDDRWADQIVPLAEIDARRARLRTWAARLDEIASACGEGAVAGASLFGAAPADRVFTDNCHLTEAGADLAAAALARICAERIVARSGRPPERR